MPHRIYFPAIACLALSVRLADAQSQCRIYLANHSDATHGVTLSLEAQADSTGKCQLSSVNIILSVGDGTQYRHVNPAQPPSWQTGGVYTAQATITGAGPQKLLLNGQSIASNLQGAFQP